MQSNLSETLRKIGIPKIATGCGVSERAVYKWLNKNKVPSDRVMKICFIGEWLITPHQLRPDLYPNPNDGMPSNLLSFSTPV